MDSSHIVGLLRIRIVPDAGWSPGVPVRFWLARTVRFTCTW